MAGRRTNQALLVVFACSLATGGAMYAIGTGWNRAATVAHGAAGLAVLALAPWKSVVARRGARRRGARSWPSFFLVGAIAIALVTGFLHRFGLRELGPVLVMQVHVGAALVAVPVALWHVRSRPPQFRAVDVDRRTLLRGGALVGGTAVATLTLPHASDRYTRSLERGSFSPARMPIVQWFDDEAPELDPRTWRLLVGDRTWALRELRALAAGDGSAERTATLDCTGGWYAQQRWRGIGLGSLLERSGTGPGRSVRIESATGYWRRFPWSDRDHLLLAMDAGGERLSRGHGFPLRLVAPGRRGFWWVKWVTRIDVDDTPWWWQPPFPLS